LNLTDLQKVAFEHGLSVKAEVCAIHDEQSFVPTQYQSVVAIP